METILRVFLYGSPKIEKLNTAVGEIANLDIPVLIKGESGTGKEIIFFPPLFSLPCRQFILPWKTHPQMSPRPASPAYLGLRNATKKFPHGRENYFFLAAKWKHKIKPKY
jgi:hypothetical protein